MIEKNTAIGNERGINVRAIFPISPSTNINEISRVTKTSISLNSSKVRRKQMKKAELTKSGIINWAARYLCNKSFI